MREIEFKGRNVAEAVNNGLAQLGCNREDVKIKILSEGSGGLFGLMGAKPAVILVSIDNSICADKGLLKIDRRKTCGK
jgi:spoIIIJ-associated protein